MPSSMAAAAIRSRIFLPGGAGAFAREAGGLAGNRAALADPGCEGFYRSAVDIGARTAMGADPALHAGEQLGREFAVAAEQRKIGLLGLAQPVQAEIGVAAILDRFRVARFELQRVVVSLERRLVVAELAIRVTDVVPGLVHPRVEVGGSRKLLERREIAVLGLVEQFGLALCVGLPRRVGFQCVRLLDVMHRSVIGAARLLF